MTVPHPTFALLLVLVTLFLLACGPTPSPTEPPTVAPIVAPTVFSEAIPVSQLGRTFAAPLSTGLTVPDIITNALDSLVEIRGDVGTGTGFIVSNDGRVITNRHVVESNSNLTVRLATGGVYNASIVEFHETLDLAMLAIVSEDGFTPIGMGNSDDVRLGEQVIILGFPLGAALGQEPTVTQGIISAKRPDVLQTDASVNPGNSGGPMLSGSGNVVGVVTARVEDDQGRSVVGIGFAIPINEVIRFLGDRVPPVDSTPLPTSTPMPTATPTPSPTPTFTPTPLPTSTPTPTPTPHPVTYCREWEALVLEWIKQGNNFNAYQYDEVPSHPNITLRDAGSFCIINFPLGRLSGFVTVGTGNGQLFPGSYRFVTHGGGERVDAGACTLEVNADDGYNPILMPYGEPFEFIFSTDHNRVRMVCTNGSYMYRIGELSKGIGNKIAKARAKYGLNGAIERLQLEGQEMELAVKQQTIDYEWISARPASMAGSAFSGERTKLYDLLTDGEHLGSFVGGRFQKDTARKALHSGVAVATNKRVIFIDKGIFGSTETMEMPYGSIESVTYSTGIMWAGLHIIGRGSSNYRIEDIQEKDSVPVFVAFVRARMEEATNPAPTAPPQQASPLDELERLASLVERGFLSREEFEAKKKVLLETIK